MISKYFTQGKQAYQDGKHYTDNPYAETIHTDLYPVNDPYKSSEWLKGWQVAEHLASVREQLEESDERN